MVVRLTRKLADRVDGVDLSAYRVGQALHLPWRDARLLMAEGWAEMIERRASATATGVCHYDRETEASRQAARARYHERRRFL